MSGDELARVEQGAVEAWRPAAGQANDALSALGRWVQAGRDINELVAPLVDTPFVPDNYRPKIDPRATAEQQRHARAVAVATATAAVLQGTKLGFDPLTSLQQIIIIHGRPSMYAEAMVALLVSHGHEVWEEDVTDHRAIVCGRRRGSRGDPVRVEITMDMARKAGWTKNEAYAKTPRDMLYARAAARVCKRVAPEVLLGIASIEEVEDTMRASAEVGTGRRTITPPPRRPALPAADDAVDELLTDEATTRQANPTSGIRVEPAAYVRLAPVAEAVTVAEPNTPVGQELDETQWRQIMAECNRLGITGEGQKARRLTRISQIVKRAIARGSDLTYAEGESILSVLRAEPTPGEEEDVDAAMRRGEEWTPPASTGDALLDGDWPPVPRPPDAPPDTPEATA